MFFIVFFGFSENAWALRPFETTDADVVVPGEVEVELGIFAINEEKHKGPDEVTVQTPNIRFNIGLPHDIELVIEMVWEFIDEEQDDGFHSTTEQFTDTATFIKKLWSRGEGFIPSFATETGLLFPTEKCSRGIDFEHSFIFTWELSGFTIHSTIGGGTEHIDEENEIIVTQIIDEEDEKKVTSETEHINGVKAVRGLFLYGVIIDFPLPQFEKLHFFAEYSGEKVASEHLEHQILGGAVLEGPWGAEYVIATF